MQVAAAFIMLIQGQHRVKYLKLFYCCNNGAKNLKCLYEMVGWGGGGGLTEDNSICVDFPYNGRN